MEGQRFGMLTVVSFHEQRRHGALWLCQCDCGKTKVVERRRLISGETRSCGCKERNMIPFVHEPSKLPKPKQEPMKICEQGAVNLVRAIIRQTSNDVRSLPPSSRTRKEAIEFFLSDYFKELTGLEGEPILRHILQECERKNRKKTRRAEQ